MVDLNAQRGQVLAAVAELQTAVNGQIAGQDVIDAKVAVATTKATEAGTQAAIATQQAQLADAKAVLAAGYAAAASPSFPTSFVFVDSVGGNDANDGRTHVTRVKTLAVAQAIALAYGNGVNVRLLAGSVWRETLDLSTLTEASVEGYGDLIRYGLPVVRGDDVITTTWRNSTTRGDAYTEVYSLPPRDFDITDGQAGIPPSVYEDNVIMNWVTATTLAACQATPGSFFHDGSKFNVDGVTVYIHPTGSTNPATNGRVYSVTERDWAIRIGNRSAVRFLEPINQAHDNGAINAPDDCIIENVLCHGNIIHPILAGSGVMRNCIAWVEKIDGRHPGGFLLEFFRTNTDAGKVGIYQNCMAIAPPGYTGDGFGGHTLAGFSSPDAHYFSYIGMFDCAAINCGINWADMIKGRMERVYSQDGRVRMIPGNPTASVEIIDLYCVRTGINSEVFLDAGSFSQSGGGNVKVDGLRAYATGGWAATAGITGYNVDITNSHIVVDVTDKQFAPQFFRNTSSDLKRFSLRGTIFENRGWANAYWYYFTASPTELYAADRNVFSGYGSWITNAGSYTTLAALRAAAGTETVSLIGNYETGSDLIGTAASFVGTGWTLSGDGWDQSGAGNGNTHRLQFLGSQAGVTATLRITVTGAGRIDVRDGGTNIATNLAAGTYAYTRTWAGAPAVAPRGSAVRVQDVSWFVMDTRLPVQAVDPANGDWQVIGNTDRAAAGVRRHPLYLKGEIPQSLPECRAWVLRQVRR